MLRCPICHFRKINQKYKVEKYQYYECRNCKTLFLNPLPGRKAISTYYSSEFEYSAGKAEELRIRKRAKIILKKLKQFYPEGETLLDIGSGYGYFLDEAQKSGLITFGIEPSEHLYVQSFNRLGISCAHNTDFDAFFKKNKQNRYDFITAIHIIEHLRNPLGFIAKLTHLLNQDGILYIETPNYDSWLAKAEKENYTFLTPPDHIWLFSSRSLQLIEVRIPNLQIESISTYSHPEHLMGILKRKFVNRKSKLVIENRKKKIEKNFPISNFHNYSQIPNNQFLKRLKYKLFDRLLAPLFTPLLNLGIYGSILELYIKKK